MTLRSETRCLSKAFVKEQVGGAVLQYFDNIWSIILDRRRSGTPA